MKSKNEIRQEELEKEVKKTEIIKPLLMSRKQELLYAKIDENKRAVKNEREEVLKIIGEVSKEDDVARLVMEELKEKLESR